MGAFVVYDITKKKSLDHCQKWKEEIDSKIQMITGDPIPTVLVANKVLYNYMISYFYVYMQIDITHGSHYDGKQFSIEHNFASYFKTSAKTGEGFRDAIHFMLQEVRTFRLTATDSYLVRKGHFKPVGQVAWPCKSDYPFPSCISIYSFMCKHLNFQ